MKIAFFGTSDRTVPILETLNKKFGVALCITKSDTRVGRNQQIRQTAVKTWANQRNIPCVEITTFAKTQKQILETLLTEKIDLGIVTDFGFIITKDIINTPLYGLINIHFSLLPKYRGASPIQFAILNGDIKTGVTYQLMAPEMDKGAIIYQFEYEMTGNETSGELYKKLFEKAANELPAVIKGYSSGEYKPYPQEEIAATYTFSKTHSKSTHIFREDAKINWSNKPKTIHNMVGAFNPWPIAWTTMVELGNYLEIKGLKLKNSKENHKDLRVKIHETALIEGRLKIEKLQIAGKKHTTWSEFKNGYLEDTS